MVNLTDILFEAGLENIQTYIQSGNVIFKSSEENIKNLELKITATVRRNKIMVKLLSLLAE